MALRPRNSARDYQLAGSKLLVDKGECACLVKPGGGKTFIGLDAGIQLCPVRPILVVTPAQVVETEVWSREAAQWEHLCGLFVTEIYGTESQRLVKMMLGSNIDVISYDNFLWLTEHRKWDYYGLVIWDELSKMKHPGTKRFKRMRAWRKRVPMAIGLTGSPQGNHWKDLWGEMYAVAGPKPLGPRVEDYLDTYFKQVPRGDRMDWELRKDGSDIHIRERIKPFAFSLQPQSLRDAIPPVYYTPLRLELPPSLKKKELELRKEFETELESGTTLTALNQSKLGQAVRQFASGAIYTDEEGLVWEELHDIKMQALRNVMEELQGTPILIFTWFRHELARLKKEFPNFMGLRDGNIKDINDKWNRREIEGLVINPQGSAHGLNLQYGSSSIFWWSLPWSRELFDQGNGREARIGQPDPFVTAHIPLVGAIDRYIWSKVEQKGADEQALMDAVQVEV